MSKDNNFMTTSEVANDLDVSEKTLRRWRNRDVGPPFVQPIDGGTVRYPREKYEEWLEDEAGRQRSA